MSRTTKKLIWSAPLLAALAVLGALALFVAQGPQPAQAHDPPGVVENLMATVAGQRQIDLTWDAPTTGGAPTGYRIDYSSAGNEWRALATDVPGTSYSDTSIPPGSVRYYRVFALNAAGPGPVSRDYRTQSEGLQGPPVVFEVTATAVGRNQINLTWEAPTENGGAPITLYYINWANDLIDGTTLPAPNAVDESEIYQDGTGLTDTSGIIRVPADRGLSFEHMRLSADTRYRYRVYAYNSALLSPTHSDTVGATTWPVGRPSEPRELTVVHERTTINIVSLYWFTPTDNGGSNIGGYEFEVSYNGGAWADINLAWGGNSDDAVADASGTLAATTAVGDTVQLRVRTTNFAGLTSQWVYGPVYDYDSTDDRKAVLHDRPGTVNVQRRPNGNVELSWSLPPMNAPNIFPSAISGYRIDVSDDGNNWEPLVANTGRTTPRYEYVDPANVDRYYRVFAWNAQYLGDSQPTRAQAELYTGDVIAPGHVRNFTARATGPTEITLNWDPPLSDGGAPITGYRVDAVGRLGGNAYGAFGTPVANNPFAGPATQPDAAWRRTFNNGLNTTFVLRNLNAGSQRLFRVLPVTDKGAAAEIDDPPRFTLAPHGSAETRAARTADPPLAPAPMDLTAEDAKDTNLVGTTNRGVLLLWNSIDLPAGTHTLRFRVQRKVDDGEWETIAMNTGNGNTDYTDSSEPAEGELRAYRVAAIASSNSGAQVGMYSAPVYYPHHLAPHNTMPMAGAAIADQTLTEGDTAMVQSTITDADMGDMLSWEAMSNMNSVATAMADDMGMVTVTAVAPGTATIMVTATDMAGASAMQTFMVTVNAMELGPPTMVMAEESTTDPGSPMVTVSWMPGPGAAGHLVLLFNADDWSQDPMVATPTGDMHTFMVSAGTTYMAVVVSYDAAGNIELELSNMVTPASG